jgi:hypothetical protein
MQMRTNSFALTALLLSTTYAMSCGGGGGKPDEGGLVGFATGKSQPGPVPSDGTSPDAPVVAGVVATNPLVKYGDPLHINVTFADPQGDVATVNVGIFGQPTHATISVAKVGMQTDGILFIDLQPATNSPGTYVLVVSMTDLAGHTSALTMLTFTILNPDGTMPFGGVDAGLPTNPKDAAVPSDAPVTPDLGKPDTAADQGLPPSPEVGADVRGVDAGADAGADAAKSDAAVGDLATIADIAPPGDGPCATAPGGVIQSTVTGGLWFDATTWVCGAVPAATDDVQINAEVQVNLSAAKAVATCRNLTVAATGVLRGAAYTASTIAVTGDLTNLGAVRNGPDFASYDTATLEVRIGGNFTQNKAYGGATTRFVGAATQTITYAAGVAMSGTFIDDNPVSSLKAGSAITATATTLTLGTATSGRATFDMGSYPLTLSAGDFKVAYGDLHASRIVGVLGATLSADQIVASSGTLTLEGDICTASTAITGSVVVAASTAFYNQGYTDSTVTITGSLTNNGIVRHGPGYAAYGEGSMTINLSGDFVQNGAYTATATTLNGTAAQTITLLAGKTLTGKFTDSTAASPILAGSDLTIADAEFVLGADAVSTGVLRMGTYKINHPSGNLTIAKGTLEANDITGDTTGATAFTVANVVPPSGTLSISGYFPTATMKVTGNLALLAGARMYNQGYVQAYLTVTGNVTTAATSAMGSGPGYASYDSGALFLNGTKLAAW